MKEETRKCPRGGQQAEGPSGRLLSDLSTPSTCSPLQATLISAKDACPSQQQPGSQPRSFYGVVFPQELSLVREEKGRGVWRECTVEAVAEGGSQHALSTSLGKVGISSR